MPSQSINVSQKSAVTTLLLCAFLGFSGAHRFYVGKYITGVLMLCTLGGFGVWSFVDCLQIVFECFEDKNKCSILFTSEQKKYVGLFLLLALFNPIMVASAGAAYTCLEKNDFKTVAVKELDALSKGDISKAYQDTTELFRKKYSYDAFKQFVHGVQLPGIKKHIVYSYYLGYDSVLGQISDVKVGLLRSDDIITTMTIKLQKTNNSWKIYELTLDPTVPEDVRSYLSKYRTESELGYGSQTTDAIRWLIYYASKNDIKNAYPYLCKDCSNPISYEQLEQLIEVNKFSQIKSYMIAATSAHKQSDREIECHIIATLIDGRDFTIEMRLIKEGNVWKVSGIGEPPFSERSKHTPSNGSGKWKKSNI